MVGGRCAKKCACKLDAPGDHAAACPKSGRLKLRSIPLERIWRRIFREAGARVRDDVLLADTALPNIDPADGRKIEIVATGLPIQHGIPVGVDITMVSPLHADGTPFPEAATTPGSAFKRAIKKKHDTYPEMVDSDILRLMVIALETGGRMNRTALEFLDQAAAAKARSAPGPLRASMARVWRSRWVTMASIAAQDALAATLIQNGEQQLDGADGSESLAGEAWIDGGA